MSLQITNIKITPAKGSSKIKAFADVTFDKLLTIKGFKVVNGEKGLFVGLPSQQGKDQKWYDTLWITGAEKKETEGSRFRTYIDSEILKKFSDLDQSGKSFDQTKGDDSWKAPF